VGPLGDSDVASPPVTQVPAPVGAPLRRPAYSSGRPAHLRGQSLSAPARSRGKRALDLVVALAAAPIVVPLGLACALLVKLTSRGPALFRQQRVGLSGQTFSMYKFRTMREDAEERLHSDPELWDQYVRNDYKLPISVDPRVTPLGRWLRRTSLDELPQLINVVTGTMSLVGPRPVTRAQFDAFADVVDAYQAVRPGMTGYWQVNGRSDIHYPERAEFDRHYVDEWSVWLDISLILRTPFAVVGGRGAH
jgi:lipopolysaccharide/colanic/teichoic acid biosynthesis glycosyltransferase